MAKRKKITWTGIFARSLANLSRNSSRASARVVDGAVKLAIDKRRPPAGDGHWISGVAMGATGMRRFRLYRPPDVKLGERLPLMVMLHGCQQDAKSFATSTRMNRIAARERFLVLYPEQDRMSNAQGCWNWYDTSAGRAYGEVALIMKAIDQVCLMYPVDRTRVAVAGLSAGASMAALVAARHPERFRAVVMHSGIPPGTAHSTLSAMGAMYGHRQTKPLVAPPVAMSMSWPPLMVIHGGLDRVVAASNGQAAVQAWADAAGATVVKERSVQRGNRYSTNIIDYKRRGNTVATLVEIARLGHAWSGGAAKQPYSDGRGPDASRMAWAFASKHFRASATRTERTL
jgi:poly(hydroxyalkanoate) depolymerase family esterase